MQKFVALLYTNDELSEREIKRTITGSYHCGSAETNPSSIHEDVGLIPGLAQWVRHLALL